MKDPEPDPLPKKPSLSEWLEFADLTLQQAKIPTSKLDSELILASVLKKDRTFLHAHSEKLMTKQQLFHANNWLKKRAKHIPLAYIFGKKEFYGRSFYVTKDTLTPRPESENLISLYKKVVQADDAIIDVGTGSGILAITSYLESSQTDSQKFYASDISAKALQIAHNNADRFGVKIGFFHSDLLKDIPPKIKNSLTIIIANLPYVDKSWIDEAQSNELHHEPQSSLYADDDGLALIKQLIEQASSLEKINHLILEADPEQHQPIISYALKYNFIVNQAKDYCLDLKRQY